MYRHFIKVNDDTILVDRPTRIENKQVTLAIAHGKIQIYAESQ